MFARTSRQDNCGSELTASRLRTLTAVLVSAFVSAWLAGCGSKNQAAPKGAPQTRVERSFNEIGVRYKIPGRLLLAVAYLESLIVPDQALAIYEHGAQETSHTLAQGDTAFGIGRETLSIQGAAEADRLEVQADAYAAWVKSMIDEAGANLPAQISRPKDAFNWIWELSRLHRGGDNERRSLRAVFALELIALLNKGFLWQDGRNGEVLNFAKEVAPIEMARLDTADQKLMLLDTPTAQIRGAIDFPLYPPIQQTNHPKGVRIVHCPFSLSACLNLQAQGTRDGDARLGAHYILPQNAAHFDRALQIATHEEPVFLTDERGAEIKVENAVVIMLVGNSGRIVNGVRRPAIPTWLSDYQLRLMGRTIEEVCAVIAAKDPTIDSNACRTRPTFSRQSEPLNSGRYVWGQIPDYNDTIYRAYVANPAGLGGETAINFAGSRRQFRAGEPVALDVSVSRRAKLVHLERLVRCPTGEVVKWVPISVKVVRGTDKVPFQMEFFDSGPNQTGQHYLRALVYGPNKEFLGWSIEAMALTGFETETYPLASDCN